MCWSGVRPAHGGAPGRCSVTAAIVAAIVAAGVRSVAARSPHLDPAAKLDLLTNVAHAQLVA